MFVPYWLIIAAALLILVLAYRVWRQYEQIRCLKYCWIDLSDWAFVTLDSIKNYYLAELGQDDCLDDLVNFEQRWSGQTKRHALLMTTSGLAKPGEDDYSWVIDRKV